MPAAAGKMPALPTNPSPLAQYSTTQSLRRCIAGALRLCFRVRTLGHEMIIHDQPISHHYVTLCICCDILLVRDHDDRDSVLVELLEDCHDLDAGSAVE